MSRTVKIRWLNYAELAFFTAIFFSRFELVYRLNTMDPFVRRMLSVYDYEDGWGIYYCVLGIMGAVLIILQRSEWSAWNLKLIAYLCILLSFGSYYYYYHVNIVCVAAIVFYNLRQIKHFFFSREGNGVLLKWIFIPVSILLIVVQIYFPFLYY